ncbi:MAG: hypothetical protein CXX72_04800 [Methanobacteriota archaeon]|nr:MAG: hypothetical protein CXX72_04800 [Euryarchaeota archaeon]
MVDVTIVGSGIAGLFVSLRCARAGYQVALVTKKQLTDSSTNWAQGGIAGILDSSDEEAVQAHVLDTLAAGDGLCDERIANIVASEGRAHRQHRRQRGGLPHRRPHHRGRAVRPGPGGGVRPRHGGWPPTPEDPAHQRCDRGGDRKGAHPRMSQRTPHHHPRGLPGPRPDSRRPARGGTQDRRPLVPGE